MERTVTDMIDMIDVVAQSVCMITGQPDFESFGRLQYQKILKPSYQDAIALKKKRAKRKLRIRLRRAADAKWRRLHNFQ